MHAKYIGIPPLRLAQPFLERRAVAHIGRQSRVVERVRRFEPDQEISTPRLVLGIAQVRDHGAVILERIAYFGVRGMPRGGRSVVAFHQRVLNERLPRQRQIDAAEVHAALGASRMATIGDLPALELTERVLEESLRLYPPTWIYVRMARQGDRLPSGVELNAGAKLYLCPWVIHRSARYFDDPLRFDPARFEVAQRKSRPKYAYFPFGGGPRICIGQALAKLQMPLVLAMIVQRFGMLLLDGQTVRPEPKITLCPSPGIRMRLIQGQIG